MSDIRIPAMRLVTDNPLPQFAYEGDAGMDLRAACDAELAPFERMTIPCGLAIAIPDGYAGLVVPRSGLAARHGISIVNAPGLIDSNYRGEIKVTLINLDAHESFTVTAGDRIAQLVIIKAATYRLDETIPLDETVRGENGFGSSGVSL